MPVESLLKARIIDHTHTISSASPGFLPEDTMVIEPGGALDRDGYVDYKLTLTEHLGTHIDAPFHFGGPGHLTVDRIRPENLIGPAVLLDVRDKVERNESYELSQADLSTWEARHGRIPKRAIVIMFSGWQDRWDDPEAYRNMQNGTLYFPGFSVQALDWLLRKRDINGIGIDTLSFDHGPSKDYPTHRRLLEADKWALENLCNLDLIPPKGGVMVVSPLKHEGGSGGPARVFTFLGN